MNVSILQHSLIFKRFKAGKKVVPAPSSDNKSKQAQNKRMMHSIYLNNIIRTLLVILATDNAEGLHAANQHEKLISDVSQHDYFLFGREIILINDGSSLPELALVIEYQNTKTLIVSMKVSTHMSFSLY